MKMKMQFIYLCSKLEFEFVVESPRITLIGVELDGADKPAARLGDFALRHKEASDGKQHEGIILTAVERIERLRFPVVSI